MTCQQVQINLSLYLYGELEFAREEELESHLADCALCQLAVSREKTWHTKLNAEREDVPLDLLAQCRRDLRVAVHAGTPARRGEPWFHRLRAVRFSAIRWSPRLAFASLFLFLGFSLSRWTGFLPAFNNLSFGSPVESDLAPSISHVRAVQGGDEKRIRIVVDQVQQHEIVGSINDAAIRELVLQGSKDPANPGLRVDSVQLLNGQDGSDIRDALIYSVSRDENAAVRLKAVEALRRFRDDRETRDVLLQVLAEDPNPAVRTEAIDVLAPANSAGPVSPDLAVTLQSIIQSEPGDNYLHARCLQLLRSGKHSGLY